MTVKEFAEKMGMSVNGLCEVTGMSRQGLHDIIIKRYVAKNSRWRSKASENLLKAIEVEKDRKIRQAQEVYEEQIKMLQLFYNECIK